jgi:hypothetical protein
MKKIKTKPKLFSILDKDEQEWLDDQYDDLSIEDGYFVLQDYYRKNYDEENWIPILRKVAMHEKIITEITFVGEDDTCWGYRVYPDGKLKNLQRSWEEVG